MALGPATDRADDRRCRAVDGVDPLRTAAPHAGNPLPRPAGGDSSHVARTRADRGVGDCRQFCRVERLRFRSEEHTSELQSLMRISYAVFCLKNKQETEQKRTPINKTNNK